MHFYNKNICVGPFSLIGSHMYTIIVLYILVIDAILFVI